MSFNYLFIMDLCVCIYVFGYTYMHEMHGTHICMWTHVYIYVHVYGEQRKTQSTLSGMMALYLLCGLSLTQSWLVSPGGLAGESPDAPLSTISARITWIHQHMWCFLYEL